MRTGILERDIDKQVEFGSIDYGKTIIYNDEHLKPLRSIASRLRLAEHSIVDSNGQEVRLPGSIELKVCVRLSLWPTFFFTCKTNHNSNQGSNSATTSGFTYST